MRETGTSPQESKRRSRNTTVEESALPPPSGWVIPAGSGFRRVEMCLPQREQGCLLTILRWPRSRTHSKRICACLIFERKIDAIEMNEGSDGTVRTSPNIKPLIYNHNSYSGKTVRVGRQHADTSKSQPYRTEDGLNSRKRASWSRYSRTIRCDRARARRCSSCAAQSIIIRASCAWRPLETTPPGSHRARRSAP